MHNDTYNSQHTTRYSHYVHMRLGEGGRQGAAIGALRARVMHLAVASIRY